jgi:2-polyprenyl-3-methyl-5-hydroxy-6-metoxy-1,4-benzoquinol methylase
MGDRVELETKHAAERAKWDQLAAEELTADDLLPPDITFRAAIEGDDDMSFVAAEVEEFVGDLNGESVLELGCGRGVYAVLLARCGALVTATDLSPGSIEHTRHRAELNGVTLNTVVTAAEELPFPDESFDMAFGTSVLHHLEVGRAGPELTRVIKPGGKAFFREPMGMNPLLRFARDHVPYPYKNPRGADRPLSYAEIEAWGRGFSRYWFRECQLLSMIERGFGFHHRFPRLRRFDHAALGRVPALRRWARLVAIFGIK